MEMKIEKSINNPTTPLPSSLIDHTLWSQIELIQFLAVQAVGVLATYLTSQFIQL